MGGKPRVIVVVNWGDVLQRGLKAPTKDRSMLLGGGCLQLLWLSEVAFCALIERLIANWKAFWIWYGYGFGRNGQCLRKSVDHPWVDFTSL